MLNKIISVATIQDLKIWSVGSVYVKKFINAEEYKVIIPNRYLDEFSQRNKANYL